MQNIAEWKDNTPLHTAAKGSNLIAMRMLCAPGIDLGARNAMGHTALDLVKTAYDGSPPAAYVELLRNGAM